MANGVFMQPGTVDKSATEEEIKNVEIKMDRYIHTEWGNVQAHHVLVNLVTLAVHK